MSVGEADLKMRIALELAWDSRVDASQIEIEVNRGRVCLRGSVPSYLARQAAEEDVRAIAGDKEGDKEIDNQLAVQYPLGPAALDDEQIRANVENVLRWSAHLDADQLQVSVSGGVVTLSGSVRLYWQKEAADDLVTGILGVVGIVNKLSVVPTQTIEDRTIADQIVAALDRNQEIDIDTVDVLVERGRVTLSGVVPTWRARRAAYNIARFTQGVIEIHNQLQVE